MDQSGNLSYTLTLAGVGVNCRFRYAATADYFGSRWLTAGASGAAAEITEPEWNYWRREFGEENAYAEYTFFSYAASDELLSHSRCIFHSVALRFRDKAWLICAGPGVGKSTQLRCLQELYPGEFSVICGDRPALDCSREGEVLVCPSPWNGKEGWHGAEAAPLAGIICLKRGEENEVYPLNKRDAVLPVYNSVFHSRETEENIRLAAAIADKLLNSAPVWQMVNKGIPDSTRLLYKTVFSGEGQNETL